MITEVVVTAIVLGLLFCLIKCISKKEECCCIICSKNKKSGRAVTIAALAVLLVLAFMFMRSVLVFNVLLIALILINYYQGRLHLPFDITPSLVFVIVVSMKLGLAYGLVLLFAGDFVPGAITGGFNHMTVLYASLAAFISYLASLRLLTDVMMYGSLLIIVQSIISFLIARFFASDPQSMVSVVVGLGLNILYMAVIGTSLFSLL